MKKILILLMVIGLVWNTQIQAQVSISTTCNDPDASAMLDVQSTDKGMLIPRMTATEMSNISSPTTGLVVFNTTESKFYYYLPTAGWIPIDTDSNDGDAWGVTGEDQSSIIGRSGDVGIGTTTPDAKLEVVGKTIINRNNQDLSSYLPSLEGLLISNIGGTNGSYALRVVTDTDATPREGLIVTNAGNVGIGSTNPSAKLEVNGGIDIDGNNVLEFGAGVSGKEGNSGKIGYETFTPNTLDIVGAGTAYDNRKIKFWNDGGAGFTGNLGIGTMNPNESLEVIGNIRMTDGNQGAGKVMVSDANGTGSWADVSSVGDGDAWAVSGEDQASSIGRAGNVGIGTTNPQETLHVDGGNVIILSDSSTLKFLEDLDDGNDGTGMHLTYDGTEDELNFSSYSYNSYQRTVMTVQRNGHIGIGTRSPDQELHIKSTGNSDIMLEPENGLYSWDIAAENGTSGFNIANYDGSAFHYYMTILTNGNMGVGTRNPNETLEVNGSIRMTDGNQAVGKVMVSDADGTGSWQDASTIGDGDAWAVTGEDQTSAIGRTGNVGIGTTTPNAKLEVNGGINIDGNNVLEFGADVSGKEGNAGKIGYETFTANTLDIVGAGTANNNRKIKFFNEGGAGFTGNVGIGTTNPNESLEVIGNIRMIDGNQGAGKVMVSDANGTGNWTDASNINDGDAWAVTGEDQTSDIGRTGNVGIGTTTPSVKLEITGKTIINRNNQDLSSYISSLEGLLISNIGSSNGAYALRIVTDTDATPKEGLVVTNSANVGIGTTNPGSKLDVNGHIRMTDGNEGAGKVMVSDANGTGSWQNASSVADGDAWAVTGEDQTSAIGRTGNVGIGTTTPSAKLEVNGGIDIDGNNALEFGADVSGKEPNSGKIGYETFTANTLDIVGAGTASSNRKIKFWNDGGAGFTGKVGIGTTSPSNILHTVGGAVRFDRGGKTLYVNPNFGGSNTYSSIQYDADLGFRFYEGGDIRMDINEGGDVGIGTSSPFGKLHVFGNTGNEIAFFQTPDGVNANISIVSGVDTEAAADGHWKLGTNDDGRFHIRDAKVATNRLIIDPNGYVGIGVANPTYRLQLPNNSDASGRGRANAWYTYSDSRLKTEQTTINYGLQTIMQLQPKRYNQHTANFENGSLVLSQDSKEIDNTIGFIAQELNKVVPEATYQPEDESKDLWSIDYEKIIPILVKAVQELKTENDALKVRLIKLEK